MNRKFLLFLLLILWPGSLVQAAPVEFTFTSLDGNTYSAARLRGTPLVINIGSHW